MTSEFGKGLVICLVKFAEHFMALRSHIEMYEKLKEEHGTSFGECRAIRMWANGASDHLYEIEVPEGKEWNKIREQVKTLQDRGLEMGHGINENRKLSMKDAMELMDETRKIALMIDRKLGLKPQEGKW